MNALEVPLMFCCLVTDAAAAAGAADNAASAGAVLEEIARACSPRVQASPDGRAVVFDASGLDRAIGTPAEIGAAVAQLARDRGLRVRVAIARTSVAAWLLAHAREGVTVAVGNPREALAALPLGWLAALPQIDDRPKAPGPRDGSGQGPKANGQRRNAAEPGPTGEASNGPLAVSLGPDSEGVRRASHGPARNYRMAPGPAQPPRDGAAVSRRAMSDDVRRAMDVKADRDVVAVLERWGIRTLGDLARLPRADIHARTGPAGVRLHQAASGEDTALLVPDVERAQFGERLQLEWPIEGLEPLSFVLARLCDALSRSLERADRGAVAVETRLLLVSRETHARTLHLPAPMRDARVLRTLILLDLESHPPAAAIDAIEIELDVVAGRIVQGSLLARALPSAEDLATLVARLQALAGETRVGAPALVDGHDERAFAMRRFAPATGLRPQVPGRSNGEGQRPMAKGQSEGASKPDLSSSLGPEARGLGPDVSASVGPVLALRRIRRPIPARVQLDRGLPSHLQPSSRAVPVGRVVARAGPWRTSGHWWNDATRWEREEWDVEIAGGGCYRVARSNGQWEVEAEID